MEHIRLKREQNAMESIAVKQVDWNGMDLDWTRITSNGSEWSWIKKEWNGSEWIGIEQIGPE